MDDKAEIDMTAAEYSISSPPVTTSDVCVGISGASVDDKAEIDMTAAEVSISSPPVKRKKVETKVSCQICGVEVIRRNLKQHNENKHSIFKKAISSKRHHDGVCIDAAQGIFIISADITNGTPSPIHVQKIAMFCGNVCVCKF